MPLATQESAEKLPLRKEQAHDERKVLRQIACFSHVVDGVRERDTERERERDKAEGLSFQGQGSNSNTTQVTQGSV